MALGVSGGDVILDTNGYYAPLTFVRSLSGVSGDLTLAAGSNVTITPSGNTLTIASTASGGPPTGTAGGGLSGTYPNPTVVSTSSNTPNSIVSRDGSGSFQANNLVLGALGSVSLADGCVGQSVIHVGNLPFLTVDNCSNNTFAGREAGQPGALGGLNSAFGALALDVIDTGNYNSAFGASALRHNTSGNYNSAFGLNALLRQHDGLPQHGHRPGALSAQSYANGGVHLGLYNTAVGYGVASRTTARGASRNGVRNTAVGAYALLGNTIGYSNTAAGAYAERRREPQIGLRRRCSPIPALTTGAQNTFIGYGGGHDVQHGLPTARRWAPSRTGCGRPGEARWALCRVDRREGRLERAVRRPGQGDIRDLDLGLDFVLRLRPVEYTLKIGNGRRDLGFLAQDVEAVLGADYNVVTVGGDPARTLSLRYTDLIAPVVKAIQEQEAAVPRGRRGPADTDRGARDAPRGARRASAVALNPRGGRFHGRAAASTRATSSPKRRSLTQPLEQRIDAQDRHVVGALIEGTLEERERPVVVAEPGVDERERERRDIAAPREVSEPLLDGARVARRFATPYAWPSVVSIRGESSSRTARSSSAIASAHGPLLQVRDPQDVVRDREVGLHVERRSGAAAIASS